MNAPEAKELGRTFLDSVYAIPNGEKIKQCIQCGTCSASCPTSGVMEYGPREIIAALSATIKQKADEIEGLRAENADLKERFRDLRVGPCPTGGWPYDTAADAAGGDDE